MKLLQYILPIITPVDGRPIPPNAFISIYIAMNIFIVICFLILLITYFFSDERKYCSILKYVQNSFGAGILGMLFTILNGFALLFALADYIMTKIS